jgi:hypothetical protein
MRQLISQTINQSTGIGTEIHTQPIQTLTEQNYLSAKKSNAKQDKTFKNFFFYNN